MTHAEKAPFALCHQCPLEPEPAAPGLGPLPSPIVFVGEAPGAVEARMGKPFQGMAGQLMARVCSAVGQDFYAYRVTNSCLCRPKDNKTPGKKAINACRPRLNWEIREADPRLIVPMGNAAIESILGGGKISEVRGIPKWSDEYDCWVLPILHPAAVLYMPSEFQAFIRDVQKVFRVVDTPQGHVFGPPNTKVMVPETVEEAIEALTYIAQFDRIAWDIESHNFNPWEGFLLSICFTVEPGHAVYIGKALLYNTEVVNYMKRIMEDEIGIEWEAQNGKFDINWLNVQLGIEAQNHFDTMLAHYTLNHTRGIHALERIAYELLDAPDWSADFKATLKSSKASYSTAPEEALIRYGGRDTDMTYQIATDLRPKVKDSWLFNELLMPASRVLSEIERRGIMIDQDHIGDVADTMFQELSDIDNEMHNLVGREFNPQSWQQVSQIMYEDRRLPKQHAKVRQKSKGGTSSEYLEWFADKNADQFCSLMIRRRKLGKLVSTYVDKIGDVATEGIIHATFNLIGTVSGRLASQDPNMQNIPRESVVRSIFRSRPGYLLIQADYSQAELRWMAYMSEDPTLIGIYADTDRDLHDEVSLQLYGENFTYEDRIRAKAVNFGIAYGRTPQSISAEYGMSVLEARGILNNWFKQFSGVKSWIDGQHTKALQGKPITTPMGRSWTHSMVTKGNKEEVRKSSVNWPIQGSASDCTTYAMIKMHEPLKEIGAWQLVPVHDSVLVEVPEDRVDRAVEIMRNIMPETPPQVNMPFEYQIDVEVGQRWGELKEL